MALGDLRCITGLTLDCWLTNKWNWSLINIWNHIYQHSITRNPTKKKNLAWCWWDLMGEIHQDFCNSTRTTSPNPQTTFFTWNKPQFPHFLPKLAFNINLRRRSLTCRVICSAVNKYDKHLSWSYTQWKRVRFDIKRHISADRRKRESFISDKWGGEEFWKFPLGCNNNWSQTFFVVHVGGNTGGLTYLIGHV